MKASGEQIISQYTKNRMSTRPEYYSGRGATLSDLNSEKLELIYEGVKKEWGDVAAANFVQFVVGFHSLSATAFLNAFYSFVQTECTRWPNMESGDDIGPDRGDGGREAIGLAMIGMAMSGRPRYEETDEIRAGFIRKHCHEHKTEKRRPIPSNNILRSYDAQLTSCHNHPSVERLVLEAFAELDEDGHQKVTAVYEHGQWWINCSACGAQYSVVDATGSGSCHGLSFEEVTQGDGFCLEGE